MSLNEHPQFCTRGIVYYTSRRLKDDLLMQKSQQAWREAREQQRLMKELHGKDDVDPLAWYTTQQYDRLTREFLASQLGLESETKEEKERRDEWIRVKSAGRVREILGEEGFSVQSARSRPQSARFSERHSQYSQNGDKRRHSEAQKDAPSSPMSVAEGSDVSSRQWRQSHRSSQYDNNTPRSARQSTMTPISEISSLSAVRKQAPDARSAVSSSSSRRPQSARARSTTSSTPQLPKQSSQLAPQQRRRPQSASNRVTNTRQPSPNIKEKSRLAYKRITNKGAWSPPQNATTRKVFEQLKRYQEIYAPSTPKKSAVSATKRLVQ